jgi:septum formation protein
VERRLILASQSARRTRLLRRAGIKHTVVPSGLDEELDNLKLGDIGEWVQNLAKAKVQKVAQAYPHDYVLGADTMVTINGRVLGKPETPAQAEDMLRDISGKTHMVYTGIALYDPKTCTIKTDVDCTLVTMVDLELEEIRWYVETKEPMGKAGSYALQGIGGLFVARVDGDYSGVIGLPLSKTYRLLKGTGLEIQDLQ